MDEKFQSVDSGVPIRFNFWVFSGTVEENTWKSFCCFWALDTASTWAVPGLFTHVGLLSFLNNCGDFGTVRLFWKVSFGPRALPQIWKNFRLKKASFKRKGPLFVFRHCDFFKKFELSKKYGNALRWQHFTSLMGISGTVNLIILTKVFLWIVITL